MSKRNTLDWSLSSGDSGVERVARILCQARGNLEMIRAKKNWSWCHAREKQTVLKARENFDWCQENKADSLFLYWFRFRILSFSVGQEAIWLSVKLKIDLFRCRKKKILYPKKIFTFSQVTQRNFSWKRFRVRSKTDPLLRPEYIFNPLHQGRTYSTENNIFFASPWIYTYSQRRRSEMRSKETRREWWVVRYDVNYK